MLADQRIDGRGRKMEQKGRPTRLVQLLCETHDKFSLFRG